MSAVRERLFVGVLFNLIRLHLGVPFQREQYAFRQQHMDAQAGQEARADVSDASVRRRRAGCSQGRYRRWYH